MQPFLKWAGGKRWLFETKQFSMPDYAGRYIEPFLGGGAVFFAHSPTDAILSDANSRLIELYSVIRDEPNAFLRRLKWHSKRHSKEYYYNVRARKEKTAVHRAAQFLYLNRTCFNGLYRENRKGQFNVPIGSKNTVIFETDDFEAWSGVLSTASVKTSDFEDTIDAAMSGDFLFVDPPYTVRHNLNGFVKYNQTIFAWNDQIRLRDALLRAVQRGACFALTNANHESIRQLYADFGEHSELNRRSVIAGKSQHRSATTELLISSGPTA